MSVQKGNSADLVSEARCNLVVPVHPRAAQQLLPNLRGLRQSIEVPILKPAPTQLHMAVKGTFVVYQDECHAESAMHECTDDFEPMRQK